MLPLQCRACTSMPSLLLKPITELLCFSDQVASRDRFGSTMHILVHKMRSHCVARVRCTFPCRAICHLKLHCNGIQITGREQIAHVSSHWRTAVLTHGCTCSHTCSDGQYWQGSAQGASIVHASSMQAAELRPAWQLLPCTLGPCDGNSAVEACALAKAGRAKRNPESGLDTTKQGMLLADRNSGGRSQAREQLEREQSPWQALPCWYPQQVISWLAVELLHASHALPALLCGSGLRAAGVLSYGSCCCWGLICERRALVPCQALPCTTG